MTGPRALAVGIGFAFAVAITPSVSEACQCAAPRPDVATALKDADIVVEARVDAHAFVREVGFRTRLTVSKTHKGARSRKLVITAAKTCAVGFEVGKRYLVYAYHDGDGGFGTTFCSRTAPLRDAVDDLEFIASGGRAETGPASEPASPPPSTLLPQGWEDALVARLVAILEAILPKQ